MLHGGVGDLHHALVANSDGRIVWVGFGISFSYGRGALWDFDKRAAIEVCLWESSFPKQRPRLIRSLRVYSPVAQDNSFLLLQD